MTVPKGRPTRQTHLRTACWLPARRLPHEAQRQQAQVPSPPQSVSHHVVIERHILCRQPQLRHRGRGGFLDDGKGSLGSEWLETCGAGCWASANRANSAYASPECFTDTSGRLTYHYVTRRGFRRRGRTPTTAIRCVAYLQVPVHVCIVVVVVVVDTLVGFYAIVGEGVLNKAISNIVTS